MFSRGATLLILLGLVVPEALRSSSPAREPYPAVILPAGAGTISLKHKLLHLNRTVLMGRRHHKWRELDMIEFMKPIPVQYFARIARARFGISEGKKRHGHASEDERITRRWLQERLKLQGCSGRSLRVVTERMTVQLPSGKQVSSHFERPRTYVLG